MSNIINKKDLAEKLAEEFGCSKKDATAYVQFVFDTPEHLVTIRIFSFDEVRSTSKM